MKPPIVLTELNLLPRTTLPPDAESVHGELVDNQIAKYTAAYDGLKEKVLPIDRSTDFTIPGKTNAKKAVGLAALKEGDAVHANLSRKLELDMELATASAAKYPSISQLATAHGISDTALEMRFASIRDRLEKMPQIERNAFLKTATLKGDAITITAAATAPATWPLYDASALDAARAGYIAAKSPEAAQRIAAIQAAQSIVKQNHTAFRKHVEQLTGVALSENDHLSRASVGMSAAELNATQ